MIKTKQIAVLLLMVAGLTACSSGAGQGDLSSDPGSTELIYASADYTSINPALYEHGEINSLLYAGLTHHDALNQVVPGLAEEWSYENQTMTYTFTLREGLTFHDGQPLTSADVKFTLEAIMNPANGSEIASNYEEIERIETPDEQTVIIVLSRPNVAMPEYLTVGILPEHLLKDQDMTTSTYNQNPVGAGPYKLISWDIGQSIVMERFDDFYLGLPGIDRIIFKIVEDYSVRALQMKSGELTLTQVTPKDAKEFQNNPSYTIYDMETADYRGILYNFNHPFWQQNPGLPAALSFGVDRDAVVRSVLLGEGQAAWSPLQKGEYRNEEIEKYEYDPLRAQKEIEALGWKKGERGYYEKEGEELAFAISVRPSDQVRVDMAKIAAQNLQDIGVNCTVETHERTDWAGQSAFLIGWGSPFDPDDHTYKVFGTDKGANYSGYSDAEVDRLLLAARNTIHREERLSLYKEFQEAFAQNPAYTFIAYIDAMYVAKPNLKGITEQTTLGHHGVGIFRNVNEWRLE